jgi:hypothetical protein
MKNGQFMEYSNVKAGVPADLNGAAVTGPRVSLKENDSVTFIVNLGDSVAAVTDFTLRQHDAATAGNSKDLEVSVPYYKKVGAATSFTKVETTVAAANYDLSADFADSEGIVVFEVASEDLDVNGDFTHVSLDIADSTAAKICSVVHVLSEPSFKPAYSRDI